MAADIGDVRIGRANRRQQPEALWLLFSDSPPHERTQQAASILAAARSGGVSLDHLYVACAGDSVIGATWANPVPGRMAAIWPPRFQSNVNHIELVAAALISQAEASLSDSTDVALWQASLPIDDTTAQQRFAAAAYGRLATLVHLIAPLPATAGSGGGELDLVPYSVHEEARFSKLLEATYVGSLDCPELDDLRSTNDCIDGYRAIGDSGHTHWYFVRHGNSDAGCLLLARHSTHQFELVYMGLASAFRGKGLGPQLCRQAMAIAGDCSAREMFTAVDSRNAPALDVYRQAGFVERDRRQIMVKKNG